MEKNINRRRYDMDDTYIPPRHRVFHLKSNKSDKPAQTRTRPDTDESGLDKAYADASNLHLDSNGTLFVAGTKGNFLGSEWIENYKTMGVPLLENMLGIPATYNIEDNERYKQMDHFIKMHPGQVKNLVGHSKGGAVIHTWMKNNPDFKGQSRIYSTPYEDFLGKEKAKSNIEYARGLYNKVTDSNTFDKGVDKLENIFGLDKVETVKGETRIANVGDPAAFLDGSAERYTHQNPLSYLKGGGPHDYHEGIARLTSGFGISNTIQDKPGTDYDPNYSSLK